MSESLLEFHSTTSEENAVPEASYCRDFSDGISTESATDVIDPGWEAGMTALLRAWHDSSILDDGLVVPPTLQAIDAAMVWMCGARTRIPQRPPTYIAADPSGGIFLERREGDMIVELIFGSDRMVERTIFKKGKVLALESMSLPVQSLRSDAIEWTNDGA